MTLEFWSLVRNQNQSSTSLSFRWSDPLHHGCKTLHGASPGSAAGCRFCKSRHARAVEGKARDWCWRGSREEDGPPGGRAAASDAAGFPTQPAGHGFPNAHEPAPGSPHYYHQRSVLPVLQYWHHVQIPLIQCLYSVKEELGTRQVVLHRVCHIVYLLLFFPQTWIKMC